jgi:hypothetical protein
MEAKRKRSFIALMGVSLRISVISSWIIIFSPGYGLVPGKKAGAFRRGKPWIPVLLKFLCGGYYRRRPNRTWHNLLNERDLVLFRVVSIYYKMIMPCKWWPPFALPLLAYIPRREGKPVRERL